MECRQGYRSVGIRRVYIEPKNFHKDAVFLLAKISINDKKSSHFFIYFLKIATFALIKDKNKRQYIWKRNLNVLQSLRHSLMPTDPYIYDTLQEFMFQQIYMCAI